MERVVRQVIEQRGQMRFTTLVVEPASQPEPVPIPEEPKKKGKSGSNAPEAMQIKSPEDEVE